MSYFTHAKVRWLTLLSAAVLLSGCEYLSYLFSGEERYTPRERSTQQESAAQQEPVTRYVAGRAKIGYAPPSRRASSGRAFSVAGTTQAQALRNVAASLQKAGFSDVRVDSSTGSVTGRVNGGTLQDCGTVIVREGRQQHRFEGTTPLAIIPLPGDDPTAFLRRQFAGSTTFRVIVRPTRAKRFGAQVEEQHTAQITHVSADGTAVVSRTAATYVQNEVGSFASGARCVSKGALQKLLN